MSGNGNGKNGSLSQSIVNAVSSLLIHSKFKRQDAIAYRYLAIKSALNFLSNEEEKTKEAILNGMSPRMRRDYNSIVTNVQDTGVGTKIILEQGRYLDITCAFRQGRQYVDMEELRRQLNVSEDRFARAVEKSTRRYAVQVQLDVVEK